jgi:RluA family pseudouridine synthase
MQPVIAEYVVPDGTEGVRLDRFLLDCDVRFPSRASARKAVKRGWVLLDEAPARSSWFVRPGQSVQILEPPAPTRSCRLDLPIVHSDEHMAVVVKPPGVATVGWGIVNVQNALLGVLGPSTAADALAVPRPAHRLDAPTGGILVVGRSASGLMLLNRAFQERRVSKEYVAIAIGRLEGDGQIDEPLDGRPAVTQWRAEEHTRHCRFEWLTRVSLRPITGRTHQLRRHLLSLGHPILGDGTYSPPELKHRGKGLFLWARSISIPHPSGDMRQFTAEPSAKFTSYPARQHERCDNPRPNLGTP